MLDPVIVRVRAVIIATSAACLLLAGGAAQAGPDKTSVTQVASPTASENALQQATERALQRVQDASRQRNAALADKATLAAAYEKQLAEIDRLKQRRASWRRDRLIRTHMSESHGTAQKLAALDQRIRRYSSQWRAEKRALVRAIDRELASQPTTARRARLARWRGFARRGLERSARKIVLPDDDFDPLADPEELDYQASLLRQSEDQLLRELARLEKQAERYQHMAALRKKRNRATELSGFDNDQPRRSTGRSDGFRSATGAADEGTPPPALPEAPAPDSAGPGPTPSSDPQSGDITDDPMFDVILADVVDASTVNALRAAGLSNDPTAKARAAQRAHKQVEARLKRLQKRRQLIQKRARTLRRR